MKTTTSCVDDLKALPVFEDLADTDLAWLEAHGSCLELDAGDVVWSGGQPADAMFVLLSGRVQLAIDVAGQTMTFEPHRIAGVFGLLPYSRMTTFNGRNTALEPSRILRIGKRQFPAMLQRIPELGARLMAIMADRIRGTAVAEQQREKMIALGKLAAGLAHELNNPAAAVGRSASELQQRLAASNALVVRLADYRLSAEQVAPLVELRSAGRRGGAELSTLERGDREDRLADFLEDQGAADSWVMAETLVEAGLEVDDVRRVCDGLPAAAVPDALAWVESGIAAGQILGQVAAAAGRISELVGAVKRYSHMDQNPDKQPVNLHQGLETTLSVLAHALKKKNVRLSRRFASDLPEVPGLAGELNQVWTNLLDNAIDAVSDGGEIEIETGREGDWLVVKITDDGAGIAEDARSRIFEPFYTTKAVGEGTGLGLDIVRRIVEQHAGEVTVASEPGRTVFSVRLPLS